MAGPELERVAAVFGERQGSGYLLNSRAVLTSWHVVGQHSRPEAVVPGGRGRFGCSVVWFNRRRDAALLQCEQHLVPPEQARHFTPLAFAAFDGTAPIGNCQAVGFPLAQRDEAGHLDTEHFVGTLKFGSGVVQERWVLDTEFTPPRPRADGRSPWAGMSGAAVFVNGQFLGLVAHDPVAWQHGRLAAVRAGTLVALHDFRTAYEGLTGSRPVRVYVHADPTAAFERDYTAFIARKYGRLTIFGLDLSDRSRATWPLDSAYLSLEATGGSEWRQRPDALFGQPPVPTQTVQRADEALAGQSRVLLRGVAGSGKTTLVQWLATSAAKQDAGTCLPHLLGKIPFVLPLRTVVRRGELPSPDEFLASTGNPLKGRQPAGWAEDVLNAGRGLLLIDGMDEIPERERDRTRAWLRDLLLAFPGNLWLVTSRPSAVTEGWLGDEGFTDLTLSPMTRAEVTTFVERWHNAARRTAQDDPEELERLDGFQTRLLEALHTKQDLARLATNPLMCGLICALHRDRRAHLPRGRKDLYDAALSMLLARRDQERDMGNPDGIELSEEAQKQLLQRLAYWLIRNGQVELEHELARELIADALPSIPAAAEQGDAEAILRHLLVRSGLLRQPTLDTVDFVHRTFQDYLGAKAAVEARDLDLMVRNAHDDQWEDVIRMAVAHARPDERARLLRKLIQRGDKVKSHRTRLHLLAMACLEHATELDPAVREMVESRAAELIPPGTREEAEALATAGPVILELLPGPEKLSSMESLAVVQAAAAVGSDAAIPVLARFRTHPFLPVTNRLASAWHGLDTDRYAREVIEHLPRDSVTFLATSREELCALRRMGGRPKLRVQGPFPESELLEELGPEWVVSLELAENPVLGDPGFLHRLPKLESLYLTVCPSVRDLSVLRDIRLEHLGLAQVTLSGLPELAGLSSLAVFPPMAGDLQSTLPREAPLTRLFLGASALSPSGLRGLGHWRTLRRLAMFGPAALDDEEWAELAALPALSSLQLPLSALGGAAGKTPLPAVESLSLNPVPGPAELGWLPEFFPGVKEFNVAFTGGYEGDPRTFQDLFPDAVVYAGPVY